MLVIGIFSFSHNVFNYFQQTNSNLHSHLFCPLRQDSFLSHRCPLFRQWLCGKAASGLQRILCGGGYRLKEPQKSMDMCTGRCDITELLLKTALNTITMNRSVNIYFVVYKVFVFRPVYNFTIWWAQLDH